MLTEAMLFGGVTRSDRELAESYVNRVVNPVRDGQTLRAQVQGVSLYEVQVRVTGDSILNTCTCAWGGNCKHVYALLLKWLQAPAAFTGDQERPLAVQPVEPPPTARPAQPPAWLAVPFAARQQEHIGQLERSLQHLRVQDLRAMARRRGWRLKGTDKAGIVGQVARAMARPQGAVQAAQALDEEQRRVLAALTLLGDAARGEAAATLACAWGANGGLKQLSSHIAVLQDLGLALPLSPREYGPLGLVCPDAIARGLLPVVHEVLEQASPGLGREASGPAGAELRLADPFPLVRAASQMVLLLERAPVGLRPPMPRPLAERQFPGLRGWDYDPAEIRRALEAQRVRRHADLIVRVPAPQPSLPDEAIERLAPVAGGAVRLEFTYALLVAAGIFQPGSPVTVWPEVKRQYLCRNELEQRAVLARAYFSLSQWSEVWSAWQDGDQEGLEIKRHAGYAYYTQERLRSDLAARRQLVLRALACLPEGRWIALADLFHLLRPAWPRFDELRQLQPGYYGPATGWFLARGTSDARFIPNSDEDWDLAQGRFVRQVLAGPLHWLGLADLRLHDGELEAFRLQGLADLFWDRVEAPPAPPHAARASEPSPDVAAVTVEGERIAVRPSAISAQAHGLLERIACLAVASPERFEYQLDALTVYRAYETGLSLDEVLEEWQRLLPIAMPEQVRVQLAAWWAAYGRVRIYRGLTVIEFADDYALAEMKAVTSLARHIVAEVSPRLVIIEAQAADRLVAELERAGYTPRRTEQV